MAAVLDFAAYIGKRTQGFTGREWVLAELDRWLADAEGPTFFIITGEPGVGKTSLVARLTQVRPVAAYHFCIARDMNTIDPVLFARSVAWQLCQIDGFAQEILKESKIDLKTVQNIQANYGPVIGARIETLVLNAPSGAAAFIHAMVQPLKALCEAGFAGQLVLLVDALDEAVQYTGTETIVDLLANAGALPRQVRVVLTSRPEGAVLRHFQERRIPHLLLDAGRPENLDDLRRYTQGQVAANEALGARLAKQRMAADTFIERVVSASRGNFLYLVWLLPAIAAGSQRFDTLAALPQGLDSIYREFLRTRKTQDEAQWRRLYEPVLGVLVAAQAPLTRALVEQFTGLSTQEVRYGLQDLRQFLDPVSAEQERYFLYHQSIRDWLQEERRAQEFWIDAVKVHERIANFYWKHYSDGWVTCDEYGLSSLATHLYEGGDYTHFQALFADDRWLQVRVAYDGYRYDGYLADLSQAWRVARNRVQQARNSSEGARQLAMCVHYALIHTSINAFSSNYHPALVVRAVETGLWSIERGLSIAYRVVEPEKYVTMIAALLATGCGSEEQRLNATTQALEMALALQSESSRAKALVALAPQLSSNLLARGLDAVMKFKDSWNQVQVLTAVAPLLNSLQRKLVIKVGLAIFEIQDEWNRTQILTALASLLTGDLLKKYLMAALTFQSEGNRAEVLTVFATYLSGDLILQGFAAALSMTDPWNQARVLAALAPQLTGDLLTQGLDAASAMKDRASQVRVLAALAPQLTEQQRIRTLAHAFDLIRNITNQWSQVEALVLLIPHLLVSQRAQAIARALDVVGEIADDESRAGALTALAPHLSDNVLERGLTIALAIEDEESCVEALAALALQLTNDLLTRGLVTALTLKDEWNCIGAFAALVPQLDDHLLERGLTIFLAIEDAVVRAQALIVLAPLLSGERLMRCLDTALAFQNESLLADVLVALSPRLTGDFLVGGLEVAIKIEDKMSRAKVLAALAPRLSCEQREQILDNGLAAALLVEDEGSRTQALRALAPQLTDDLLVRGVAAALELKDEGYRIWALEAFCPQLSGDLLVQGLAAVDAIQYQENRARALAALAPQLSGQEHAQALSDGLEAALAIENELRRAKIVAGLASQLTGDLLKRGLAAALGFENERCRAEALAALAPYLNGDLFELGQKAALAFESESHRAKVLLHFSGRMPNYETIRQAMQRTISEHLWNNLRTRQRSDVLGLLEDKALLAVLVTDAAASEAIAKSILDVCWKWGWV